MSIWKTPGFRPWEKKQDRRTESDKGWSIRNEIIAQAKRQALPAALTYLEPKKEPVSDLLDARGVQEIPKKAIAGLEPIPSEPMTVIDALAWYDKHPNPEAEKLAGGRVGNLLESFALPRLAAQRCGRTFLTAGPVDLTWLGSIGGGSAMVTLPPHTRKPKPESEEPAPFCPCTPVRDSYAPGGWLCDHIVTAAVARDELAKAEQRIADQDALLVYQQESLCRRAKEYAVAEARIAELEAAGENLASYVAASSPPDYGQQLLAAWQATLPEKYGLAAWLPDPADPEKQRNCAHDWSRGPYCGKCGWADVSR